MTYSFLIPFLPIQYKQVPFLLPLWLSALYKVQLMYNMELLNRQTPINFKNDRKTCSECKADILPQQSLFTLHISEFILLYYLVFMLFTFWIPKFQLSEILLNSMNSELVYLIALMLFHTTNVKAERIVQNRTLQLHLKTGKIPYFQK